MMSRNVFTPENGEVLIGVIRPSFWALARPLAVAAVLMLFPFVFAFALLGLGPFGLVVGAASFCFGAWRLRRVRKRWLLGALFVTSQRVADLVALGRRPTFVSLAWRDIGTITIQRSLVGRILGTGSLEIHAKDNAMTIVVPSVADVVVMHEFLHEVQLTVNV